MAIRKIRIMGDRILTKKCRPVDEVTPRIRQLVDDMLDTMYEIPSDESITNCMITKEVVEGTGKPVTTSNEVRFRA